MSGSATFATARFRFATAATRISPRRTRPWRSGAVDASAELPACVAIRPPVPELGASIIAPGPHGIRERAMANRPHLVNAPGRSDYRPPRPMAWIRQTDEPPERRPIDLVRLGGGVVGLVVAGLWAQSESSIDTDLFRVVNDFPNGLNGLADALYALGSIFAVAAVAIVLVVFRKWRVAEHVALAGVLAWGVAELLHEILDAQQ